MADTFICTEHAEHVNSLYSGQEGAPDRGQSWFECAEHGIRVRAGYYDAPDCPDHVCGHPKKDHPSTAQRYKNEVDGFPIWHHSYDGDKGPCQQPVGMHKLVGFLCIDCGAPLDGMPVKE
jgi:hypothetical protein